MQHHSEPNNQDPNLKATHLRQQIGMLRQQLDYFRASVYKQEARENLERCLTQLSDHWRELHEDRLLERLRDFEAEPQTRHQPERPPSYPGECLLSRALLRLIAGLEQELAGLEHPPEPDAGQRKKGCGPSKRSPRAFEAT